MKHEQFREESGDIFEKIVDEFRESLCKFLNSDAKGNSMMLAILGSELCHQIIKCRCPPEVEDGFIDKFKEGLKEMRKAYETT